MNCIGLLLGFYFGPAPLVVWRPPNSTHIQTIFFELLEPPFQIAPLRSVANTKGVGRGRGQELVRYIQLNPARLKNPEELASYPWSSHHAYLGRKGSIAVDSALVLEQMGNTAAKAA